MSATSDAWPIYRPTSQSKPLDALISHVARGGVYTIASTAERATLLAALAAAGQPAPSATVPLLAWRADAAPGRELEYTKDGALWAAVAAIDSGWITFASGLTAGTSRYREVDGIGYVNVDGTYATTSGTTHTISSAPLPAAIRPTANMRAGAYFGGFPGSLSINNLGDVTAIQNSGAGRTSVSGVIVYPLG